MQSNNSNSSNGSRAAWARGFMALFAIVLAMGLALMASPVEAAPSPMSRMSRRRHCLGDRHGHEPSVVATLAVGGRNWRRRHPGRETVGLAVKGL